MKTWTNLRQIAVPVDMSPASENALIFACQVAEVFEAEVEAVYAMDSIFDGAALSASGFLVGYRKTMQDEINEFVRKATKKCKRKGIPEPALPVKDSGPVVHAKLRTNIEFGYPEEVLMELSERVGLIIMGTTGRGDITRKLFGSVSIYLSKNAHCPVLLVPPDARFAGFRNILYASNFESLDPIAIRQTVEFARRFNAQLHFVHVGQPGEKYVELEKKLFEINYKYADPAMPFIFSKVIASRVVEGLHEYAFENRVDLFIFITHDRSFWENLLHHSISKEMLLHTNMPVLVNHFS